MNKRRSFEYLLGKLQEWYAQSAPIENNDLSVLKSLKLLFLITAADIELSKRSGANPQDLLITTTFNNFHALPLGHVESDIYDWIKETRGHLGAFVINRVKLTKQQNNVLNTEDVPVERIDQAVEFLNKNFNRLIYMQPFQLVELTHRWSSWKFFYRNDTVSKIPTEVIIEELKHFS